MVPGDPASALARVELALDVAEARNLPAVLSEALNTKGMALADHPHESRALLREALAIALEHDLIRSALRAYNNLMIALWATERAEEAEALRIEALELARSRGNVNYTTWFASGRIPILQQDGEWDEAFQLAEDIGPRVEVNQGNPALARCVLAEMALERDDRDSAAAELDLVCPGLEIETATDFQQRSLVTFRETLRARADGRPDDILAMVEPWAMLVLDQGYDEAAASVLGRALDVAWKDEASPLFERVARGDRRALARAAHPRGGCGAGPGPRHACLAPRLRRRGGGLPRARTRPRAGKRQAAPPCARPRRLRCRAFCARAATTTPSRSSPRRACSTSE